VFDNDVMAATVVAERRALGVRIPEDLAVVAGEDSILCRLADPAISALRRDVTAAGVTSARVLLDVMAGRDPGVSETPGHEFIARASSTARQG
jgi:DNA-binding LacI/PurR family transcriptional regulator